MKKEQETSFVICEGVVVPESALGAAERPNRYGSVPGLDDEELADPDELERQIHRAEFGPVLALPVRQGAGAFRPELDDSGFAWGAFASVDFERTAPESNKVAYKIHKLREELRDALILLSVVRDRMPGRAKYQLLKYLQMGIIDFEHLEDEDMRILARYHLRARRIEQEIRELEAVRRQREEHMGRTLFGDG
jgi:hypothetical protein